MGPDLNLVISDFKPFDPAFALYTQARAQANLNQDEENAPLKIGKVAMNIFSGVFTGENDDFYGRRLWALPGTAINVAWTLVHLASAIISSLIRFPFIQDVDYLRLRFLFVYREIEFTVGRFVSLFDIEKGFYLMGEATYEQIQIKLKAQEKFAGCMTNCMTSCLGIDLEQTWKLLFSKP